jgi:hypothetical protein
LGDGLSGLGKNLTGFGIGPDDSSDTAIVATALLDGEEDIANGGGTFDGALDGREEEDDFVEGGLRGDDAKGNGGSGVRCTGEPDGEGDPSKMGLSCG